MDYVQTVCPRDCYDTCFMKVYLDDSRKPVRVVGDEINPVTQGFLCPRGVADIKRAYSPERILYPHKRIGGKPNGSFKRISWDEALNILAKKITNVQEQHGAESMLHLDYTGNMGLLTLHFAQRLFYALGFSQTDLSLCSKSGHEALSLHYGLTYGVDPDTLPNMKLTVYWGFNAAVSAPHLFALSLKSRNNDGTIVAVDPRQSETAMSADLWLQPKPGSDVALAYGVMKHLIDNDLFDADFVQKYTIGFDRLKERVTRWNAETVEEYTGLEWDEIAKLAELYASKKPSATMIGLGMQKSLNGAESTRAIALIPSLLGLHRGFYYTNGGAWNIDTAYLTRQSLTRKKINVVSQVAVGRHLENGDFKLVWVYNMNPAETLPNQHAVRRGLARRDVFVVAYDTHWTETTKLADLVLPAPTFLEKEDIVVSYSHKHMRKSNKVMEPLGESRDELWTMMELARRLNLREERLYEDCWKAVQNAFSIDAFEDGTFVDLMDGKTLHLKMKPQKEYQTPSGKIEFYSSIAEERGLAALPEQYSLPRKNGFIFLNNAVAKYTHTQFQDVYGPLPPIVHVNPEDAEVYCIRDGDAVELFNEFGSIKLKAMVSKTVPKGILWAPRECTDLVGKPQNTIMPDTTQSLGGGPTFNTTTVKIKSARN